MPSGLATASFVEPCEVCRYLKRNTRLLVWSPSQEEREIYKKVWVHPGCRERLLLGERPPGVEVRGVPDHRLLEIVKICENQLGCVPWDTGSTTSPALTASQRRQHREREAMRLRRRVEQSRELITFEHLQMAVRQLQRTREAPKRPEDLVVVVKRLRRDGLLGSPTTTIVSGEDTGNTV